MRNRERNRLAFQEVFGNKEESGAYARFKSKLQGVIAYEGETVNPAAPCRVDFCCDVDKILTKYILDQDSLVKFFKHYVMGIRSLTKQEQTYYEQEIGRELREKKLIPVIAYFRTVRK